MVGPFSLGLGKGQGRTSHYDPMREEDRTDEAMDPLRVRIVAVLETRISDTGLSVSYGTGNVCCSFVCAPSATFITVGATAVAA
jgi:hypothetical protein